MFPAESAPLTLADDGARAHAIEAAFVLSAAVRRLMSEQLLLMREIRRLSDGAVFGTEHSLVRTESIRRIECAIAELYGPRRVQG